VRGGAGAGAAGALPIGYGFLYEAALCETARIASLRVRDGELRKDAYQEAWVRFLEYGPRTPTGARTMAMSACIDLLRKERTQQRLIDGLLMGIPMILLRQREAGSGRRLPAEELNRRNRVRDKERDRLRSRTASYRRHRRLYMREYRRRMKA
jgi:hypothetical protein